MSTVETLLRVPSVAPVPRDTREMVVIVREMLAEMNLASRVFHVIQPWIPPTTNVDHVQRDSVEMALIVSLIFVRRRLHHALETWSVTTLTILPTTSVASVQLD